MSPALVLPPAAVAGFLAGALLKAGARRLAARLAPVAPGPAWRLPVAELVTAIAVAAIVAVQRDDPTRLVLGLAVVAFLVPICLIDLDHLIIPNRLTLPAAIVAIVLGTALDPPGEVQRLVAGVAAGAILALPALLRPGAIGLGDVKLLAVLGLFLGRAVAFAFGVAFLAGSIAGVAIMLRKGVARGRRTAVPFGPFLALGGLAAVLAGEPLVRLYLDTL